MKIGIGFNYPIREFSIFNSSTIQNIFYLYKLLKNIYEEVYIVNFGLPINQLTSDISLDELLNEFEIINFNKLKSKLDLFIEVNKSIPNEYIEKSKNFCNKLVLYRTDNPYYSDVNYILKDSKNLPFSNAYDEIWFQSDVNEFNKNYLQVLYKKEVYQLPFIWDNVFIKKYDTYLTNKDKKLKHDIHDQTSKDITIFEPNDSYSKTSLIPLLIVEEVYNSRPELINSVKVMNTYKFRENTNFISFVNKLNIKKDKKVSFEARYNTPLILSEYTDVVLSHQLNGKLNNFYFDVLSNYYPLVHNSNHLPDMYKYNDNDINMGKNKLIYALSSHKKRKENYVNKCNSIINLYSVNNQHIKNVYYDRLKNIEKK